MAYTGYTWFQNNHQGINNIWRGEDKDVWTVLIVVSTICIPRRLNHNLWNVHTAFLSLCAYLLCFLMDFMSFVLQHLISFSLLEIRFCIDATIIKKVLEKLVDNDERWNTWRIKLRKGLENTTTDKKVMSRLGLINIFV